MPSIEEHVQRSRERTGKEYREIHEWIDERKLERHDITRALEFGRVFEEKYGKEGAQEYLLHLSDDLGARFLHLKEELVRRFGHREELEEQFTELLSYFGAGEIT